MKNGQAYLFVVEFLRVLFLFAFLTFCPLKTLKSVVCPNQFNWLVTLNYFNGLAAKLNTFFKLKKKLKP